MENKNDVYVIKVIDDWKELRIIGSTKKKDMIKFDLMMADGTVNRVELRRANAKFLAKALLQAAKMSKI